MNNKMLLTAGAVAAVIILAVAGVVLVLANGGSDSGPTASANTTPGATSTSSGSASSGNSQLRVRALDPIVLDPAVAQDATSAEYIVEIFSGLVRLDSSLKVQPDIASSWDVSPDGKTYTFHLNPKAAFQDGRPVVADDVKYSWERALNPDTGSVTAANFLGDIVGAKDVANGNAKAISGVKVVDDHTLAVTIDAPKSYFLYKMTYPNAFVVDQKQITANPNRWTLKPNGTGPYKLDKWAIGDTLVLKANDNFYLGAPTLKTVTFQLSGGSSLQDYKDGNVDVSGIGLDDLQSVQDQSNPLNKEYRTADDASVDYIGFNTSAPPFDDPKVRQAFAMAVDRKKIASVILKGEIPAATGILPPGIPGYTSDDKTLPYDPAKAKQLLSQSKYANNMPKITLGESGAGAQVADTTQAIVQAWKDNLGIDVQVTQAESGTFFQDIDNGKYQMFHLGWIMDYPDPEDILDVLFDSQSKQNSTHYSNPQVDAKLEQARTETDGAKRTQIYQDVEKMVLNDAPWLPMFFIKDYALVKPYVQGYTLPPMVIERYRNVTINK
ncbi:MAG TPA: peptide ABC transporter substrate-binding protein [Dehalococcoidia bacterium]|nr:peptide ABC transporter substrate-binding protein [Dehalococcoidia bacterium]